MIIVRINDEDPMYPINTQVEAHGEDLQLYMASGGWAFMTLDTKPYHAKQKTLDEELHELMLLTEGGTQATVLALMLDYPEEEITASLERLRSQGKVFAKGSVPGTYFGHEDQVNYTG